MNVLQNVAKAQFFPNTSTNLFVFTFWKKYTLGQNGSNTRITWAALAKTAIYTHIHTNWNLNTRETPCPCQGYSLYRLCTAEGTVRVTAMGSHHRFARKRTNETKLLIIAHKEISLSRESFVNQRIWWRHCSRCWYPLSSWSGTFPSTGISVLPLSVSLIKSHIKRGFDHS